VTKHNAAVTGARNRNKMHSLPHSFPSGDMDAREPKTDFRLSNRVYNSIKVPTQHQQQKKKKKERKKKKKKRIKYFLF
jgi:hypothetical protein